MIIYQRKIVKNKIKMSKIEEIKSSINSLYTLKEILSFLNIKQKLNMIIYMHLHSEFEIDAEDNKKINKAKVGWGNVIGSEYIIKTSKLFFRGEYLNSKRNGKGKEYYDDGKITFEREYLKGKRNGKGKEYYDNGNIRFEGEYLNGKKWNGKEYNYLI